tara:strand:- start:225 stop:638 length:414 start_codon:yes stop_codon:yes gene_type:complete
MAITPNPSTFTATRNGRAFYSYSGLLTGGAGAIDLIDIENVGLDDLLATVITYADWSAVAVSLGFATELDGTVMAYNVADVSGGIDLVGPWLSKIIIPAQSGFKVVSSHDGASGGASRSATVIAFPLLVPQALPGQR